MMIYVVLPDLSTYPKTTHPSVGLTSPMAAWHHASDILICLTHSQYDWVRGCLPERLIYTYTHTINH